MEKIVAAVEPWAISAESWENLEANLFAVSLFPYLAFLYYLGKPESKTPPLANFGFRFLLVFVFATAPAGIYAKVQYGDILANIDWLHGSAESFLTITNLLIVLGMRQYVDSPNDKDDIASVEGALLGFVVAAGVASALIGLQGEAQAAELAETAALWFGQHSEPSNALSLPTWTIHISSLVEWLVAMGLVWKYAEVSGNPRWKGLTWGMVPGHTSGICACTFHFFYNSPALNSVVALQALLTVVGNITLAVAAWRIYEFSSTNSESKRESPVGIATFAIDTSASTASAAASDVDLAGFEDLGEAWRKDSDTYIIAKLLVLSAMVSAGVKWGELWLDAPFQPSLSLALIIIFLPTGLNCLKWWELSQDD
ncbi:hypothetical protein CYMTET_25601 [Cymbomonas tetramitiformis]|uniref:Ycf49-like protein n=1 Tax=Cymbomonas tetramitiformis TaxID=36881 RepID=A0AAE0KZ34_9CHLO|nr:hypothetical protein CYMTET_25601 [Cymbomonas tetramitiformis]